MSRFNLSILYSHLGRLEDSLTAAQESLALYRDLMKNNHAVFFKPKVRRGLKRLARALSKLGREDEASQALEEAAELST